MDTELEHICVCSMLIPTKKLGGFCVTFGNQDLGGDINTPSQMIWFRNFALEVRALCWRKVGYILR